jgi:3-hydroxybutyryl-CoA dehydrogenase
MPTTERAAKVAVLGGGLMGSGIAESVARAGLEVTIGDVDEAAVAGAGTRIAASLQRAVSGGKLSAEDAESGRGFYQCEDTRRAVAA